MKPRIAIEQLTSQKQSQTKLGKILHIPLLRIFQAIVFIYPVIMLNNLIVIFFLDKTVDPLLSILQIVKTIILIPLLIYSYQKYTKIIEKRSAFELDKTGWHKEFLIGTLLGSGMVVLIVGILFFSKAYTIEGLNSPFILLNSFFRYAQGSFLEELLFTLIIFRLLEELSGTTIAYILVTLLFGSMHLNNDNATIQTSLFISIQQITLLAPFILTRRIWMGWAVHFSWNYFQTGIFGMANSGIDQGGFIVPNINGSAWLTGGTFGIEASFLSIFVNLSVGVPILIYAFKYRQTRHYGDK